MIRLGVCTDIDNIGTLAAMGYDYLEAGLSKVAQLSQEAFDAALAKVSASPIKVEAFNVMVPGTIRLTGPDVRPDEIQTYLEAAFPRAAALGGRVIVFGSGGARRVPEGWTTDEAWKQLIAYLQQCAPLCEKYGICIAIEPLRQAETNILHTVREGAALAAAVGSPFVGVLGDTFHMHAENEPLSAFSDAKAWLKHVHTAEPTQRVYPKAGDGCDYAAIFDALKAAGYEGRLSVEGRCEDLERDGTEALAVLRAARG